MARQRILTLLLVLSVLPAGAQSPQAPAGDGVAVVLEVGQSHYYEGDGVLVRISVRNRGATAVENPVRMPLLAGLKVRHAGGATLRAASSGEVDEPNRPARLAPRSFYGSVIDISGMYPQTKEPGRFELLWDGDGLRSGIATVQVIPAFDDKADYVGEIVTAVGTIRIDLDEQASPVGVKAFVDLAQSGFYDGSPIEEVRENQLIAAGAAPPGRAPVVFPAEQSSAELAAGTVVLRPASAAPPGNSSGIVILLAPQPAWAGQVTVLGRVVQGLETATNLSRVPSSGAEGVPPFRPLTPLRIEKILISKQNPA